VKIELARDKTTFKNGQSNKKSVECYKKGRRAMCMIYGFSGKENYNLAKTLMEFYSKSNLHPDGWGIGRYLFGEKPYVFRAPKRAKSDKELMSMDKLLSDLCIAHIRKATVGELSVENTHPFKAEVVGKTWIFAHNGTVSQSAFPKKKDAAVKGETDSERAFWHIMNAIEKDREIESIEEAVKHLANHGKFNMVLIDGERLYVHTNMRGTLYEYQTSAGVLFCTEPLKKVKLPLAWKAAPMNKLLVYEKGKLIYSGKSHKHEYGPKKQKLYARKELDI